MTKRLMAVAHAFAATAGVMCTTTTLAVKVMFSLIG
jgi:hypothetical protein